MKRYSTLYLKVALFLLALPVLALCLLWLPSGVDFLGFPILAGVYMTALLFFAILFQAYQLLTAIDRGEAFSAISVQFLRRIKRCAFAISGIYAVLAPFLYPIADADDAPGLLAFPLIFLFAASVVGVFAAVLERLLLDAVQLKTENDLTV